MGFQRLAVKRALLPVRGPLYCQVACHSVLAGELDTTEVLLADFVSGALPHDGHQDLVCGGMGQEWVCQDSPGAAGTWLQVLVKLCLSLLHPQVSALDQEIIEVDPDTKEMLKLLVSGPTCPPALGNPTRLVACPQQHSRCPEGLDGVG